MTVNAASGWALVIAVVIGFVSSLFTPGGLLIDPADSATFGEAAGVLGDNASLAQFMTFIFVVSVLLYWFGLHSLNRAFSAGSVLDHVSRFALNVFLVGYAFLVVELSIRHVVIHVLAHGVGGDPAEEQVMATTLFAASAGLHFAFLYVTSFGSAIFGYGLVRRCVGTSIFKIASWGLCLTGVFSFIALMIAEHVPAIDLHGLAIFSNVVLFLGSICIAVIGVGIMHGRREFVGEEAAA